jgi:hypothetical protein
VRTCSTAGCERGTVKLYGPGRPPTHCSWHIDPVSDGWERKPPPAPKRCALDGCHEMCPPKGAGQHGGLQPAYCSGAHKKKAALRRSLSAGSEDPLKEAARLEAAADRLEANPPMPHPSEDIEKFWEGQRASVALLRERAAFWRERAAG